MIQDLEQIECRRGVLEPGMKSDDLPVRTWCGAKIPGEARKSTNEEDILNLGGVYGDKDAGNPIEYDHLRLVLSDDVVEVEFFNRGITLFMTEGEKVKRIHRLLCTLDDRATWRQARRRYSDPVGSWAAPHPAAAVIRRAAPQLSGVRSPRQRNVWGPSGASS